MCWRETRQVVLYHRLHPRRWITSLYRSKQACHQVSHCIQFHCVLSHTAAWCCYSSAVAGNWWVRRQLSDVCCPNGTLQKWYIPWHSKGYGSLTFLNNSDAKRPCSTCVRSHAHALSHAPPGITMPTNPECTFDDGVVAFPVLAKVFLTYILVAEVSTTISEGPKNRYERLENRISK